MKIILKFFLIIGCIFFNMINLSALTTEESITLVTKIDLKMFPDSYEGLISIKNYKPNKKETENDVKIYRKNDNVIVLFLAPSIQKDQVLLRNGDKMWMYLPNSNKTLRVGSKEMSMGGEASNADIMRLELKTDYDIAFLGEEQKDEELCYKFELKAKNRTVAYDKILYWVSKAKEIPVKKELYSLSGKLIKNVYYKEVGTLNNNQIPTLVIIENAENLKYKTEMKTTQINTEVKISDTMFTLNYITKGLVK